MGYSGLGKLTQGHIRLHRVTWGVHGYIRVHTSGLNKAAQSYMGVTWGYTGGYTVLDKATQGFMRLLRITYSYTGSHKATQDYIRLVHRVTYGYIDFHRTTQGY